MINRQIPPAVHEFEAYALQTPKKHQFSNGVPLYIVENQRLNLLNFSFQIEAGKAFEPKKNVANSCYTLLRESAAGLTSAEIADFLDGHGAALNVSVNLERVIFNLVLPKRNCGAVLPFVFDMFLHPIFTEQKWQILRQQQIKNLEYNVMKNDFRASQLMISAFYDKTSPLGTLLTKAHIQAVTLDDIQQYHGATFCAENIKLFVAGNVDEAEIAILQPLVEQIPRGTASAMKSQPIDNQRVSIFEKTEETLQSSFILCQPSFAYAADGACAFSVLSTLFGGYFGSRLMQNLRERNGYTYGVSARQLYLKNRSIFYVESAVNADKTAAAIAACYEEMEKLQSELVGTEEVQLVKNYMIGQALRSVDGSISLMNNLSFWLQNGCDERIFDKNLAVIKNISAEEIRAMAQQYLRKERFLEIVVGGE